MVKKQLFGKRTRHTAAETVASTAPTPISAKTSHLIDHVRPLFVDFVEGFTAMTASREDLAPQFMKAFEAWRTETGGAFVAFVRVLVPDIPVDRNGYRAHPAFNAAMYLRRLLASAETRASSKRVKPEERPATPYQALARLVATVLPYVDPSGAIWTAFCREMNWDEKAQQRVRQLADKLGPVKLNSRQAGLLRRAS